MPLQPLGGAAPVERRANHIRRLYTFVRVGRCAESLNALNALNELNGWSEANSYNILTQRPQT